MLRNGIEDKRNFVKEARILRFHKPDNIIGFKGICNAPFALVLEYIYFDFTPFGDNMKASSLGEYLSAIDVPDSEEFLCPYVCSTACRDIMTGLRYSHEKGVAHRDLKPANVLVNNQHYGGFAGGKLERAGNERPMTSKLADFGESRSKDVQTNMILNLHTKNITNGTPIYMAPELLVGAIRLTTTSFKDLKRTDIWALGMLLFSLVNPSVGFPYRQEIDAAQAKKQSPSQCLEELLLNKQLPSAPEMYQLKQATDWYGIEKIRKSCSRFALAKDQKFTI